MAWASVPFLDLARQYCTIKPEIDAAIDKVLTSGHYILGPEVKALEQEIAALCGVKHGIGVASGSDALFLSLKALGIGPGDKIIVPTFTFFATAGAVCNVGAAPVFADINPRTFNIDPNSIEKILKTKKDVKAIIPVHLFGQMVDMDEIMEIANKYGLFVIEDAAQAIGAEYKGKKAGSIGNVGCFSFYVTKNLGAYGDGGMVVTNDDKIADRLRLLRTHGANPKYYHQLIGVNSRLDELQAAILRVKLRHLPDWTAAHQAIASQYDKLLDDIEGIKIPYRALNRTHIFHAYTVRVSGGHRDSLQAHLKEHGIGTSIYYPLPLHLQECFKKLNYHKGNLPNSEKAADEVLSLPIYSELASKEIEYIVRSIKTP